MIQIRGDNLFFGGVRLRYTFITRTLAEPFYFYLNAVKKFKKIGLQNFTEALQQQRGLTANPAFYSLFCIYSHLTAIVKWNWPTVLSLID